MGLASEVYFWKKKKKILEEIKLFLFQHSGCYQTTGTTTSWVVFVANSSLPPEASMFIL